MIRALAPLSVLAAICLAAPAGADGGAGAEIARVRVGFDGHYKAGLWTPVEVTLRGGDGEVEGQVTLTVPDGDGVPASVSSPSENPCRLTPGEEASVLLYARFGRVRSDLRVSYHNRDGVLVEKLFQAGSAEGDRSVFSGDVSSAKQRQLAEKRTSPQAIPPALAFGRQMIVVVGPDSEGVPEAVDALREPAQERTAVVTLDNLAELPDRWYGYEGVDLVVLSGSRPAIYIDSLPEGQKRIDARIAALRQWVRMGGTLLLAVGSQGQTLLGAGSPLAPLSPGKFQRIFSLRQTASLEAYCASPAPMPRLGPGGESIELRVPQLTNVEGVVEVREGDLPLVVRRAVGFGQI
ncbi:MAG: hypothetical protein ABSH20_30550, partial [Tepidisphaeraceae bacterium]